MTTAYGFVGLEHLYSTRASEVGTERIYTAVQESAAEHSRVINALMSSVVMRTTVAQEQYELPGGGTLQPLDENGEPLPVKPSGSYQVAYPIQGGGTGYGGNIVTNALMTVEEVNRMVIDAQMRDADWLRRHMLAALLDNTTWTYTDKVGAGGLKGLGDITIQPLANGDTVTYVRKGGSASTDDHYYAQAGAIADNANPYDDIFDELNEHPSNSGPYVAYISTSLKATTKALTDFVTVDDPDILKGANSDRLVSNLQRGFGDAVLGKTNELWIVEWSALPSGYGFVHAQGGGPVLKMREYPAPELQGFFSKSVMRGGAHSETQLRRFAGFGVSNRVAAVVFQIGNGTYQIPTGYATPLPA